MAVAMTVFACVLTVYSLLGFIHCLLEKEHPIVPFAFLVFFTLYLMGVGS